MFLVNSIVFLADEMPDWTRLLFALIPMAFLIAVWLLSWKLSNTGNPDVKFACKSVLHVCYVLFAAALFILVVPTWVSNMEEAGHIALGDASLYTAEIIAVFFVIWNVAGLIFSTCWHFTKKRKEMSEMDRMKLEDL